MNPLTITVNNIAEKLNVKLSKQELANKLGERFKKFIIDMLSTAQILLKSSNADVFSVEHMNEICKTYNQQILYGYTNKTNYSFSQPIQVENCIIKYVEDPEVSIEDEKEVYYPSEPLQIPTSISWEMVSGIPFQNNDKGIPSFIHNHNHKALQFRPDNSNVFLESQEGIPFKFRPNFSEEILHFYEITINNFKPTFSNPESRIPNNDDAFAQCLLDIQCFSGIDSILPFFLEFIFATLTTSLNKTLIVSRCCQLALSLVTNPSLPILFYIHPFFKIAFAIVLKRTRDPNIKEEVELRRKGAELTYMIIQRAIVGYPHVQTAVLNKMSSTLFSQEPLCVHIGALSVLAVNHFDIAVQFNCHMNSYLKLLQGKIGGDENEEIKEIVNILQSFPLPESLSQKLKSFVDE